MYVSDPPRPSPSPVLFLDTALQKKLCDDDYGDNNNDDVDDGVDNDTNGDAAAD